jgi:hypothetical protein
MTYELPSREGEQAQRDLLEKRIDNSIKALTSEINQYRKDLGY